VGKKENILDRKRSHGKCISNWKHFIRTEIKYMACEDAEPGRSVSTVCGYGLDDREIRSPAEARDFSST
jgi:hypothetical protein